MPRTPTRSQRMIDALLGVRRRRRQLAYVAILGGIRALRPMLWRLAGAAAVFVVALSMR